MSAEAAAIKAWVRRALGHECRDPALFVAALTHRSFGGSHNERLEFLGDAVLSLVVADWLFSTYPKADEGALSRYRAHLVNAEVLADVAERLALGERLFLGGGELKSGGFRRRSILADALEALLGAVYLDAGLEPARALIQRLLAEQHAALPEEIRLKDPKSQLQEWLQGRALALPVYSVTDVSGDPPDQVFTVLCEVAALELRSEATGSSRRRAEQSAAERLLAELSERR